MILLNKSSFNIGLRLVRSTVTISGSVSGVESEKNTSSGGKMLIAYFSWSGNTEGATKEIQSQTGADLFKIELVKPYSSDYNTVLDETQRDQNNQAKPELSTHIENIEDYDVIFLDYPNWWVSIPMPIASFLEEYDLSGKTIIPFCSHGGGLLGKALQQFQN